MSILVVPPLALIESALDCDLTTMRQLRHAGLGKPVPGLNSEEVRLFRRPIRARHRNPKRRDAPVRRRLQRLRISRKPPDVMRRVHDLSFRHDSDRVPATPGRRGDQRRGILRARSHGRRPARGVSTAPPAAEADPVATE